MPASIFIDAANQIIHISLTGTIVDADLIELSRKLRADPSFQTGFDILYDCREMEHVLVSGELVRALASAARGDTNRLALVATAPAAFGLARMYQIVTDSEDRIRVFSDMDEAIAWLLER